jgi:cystathionine gamma-synthase
MSNSTTFKPIPCGKSLPQNNIHSVSVSLPTLKDVIDYEEDTNDIKNKITTGYPRFVTHIYIKKMATFLRNKYSIDNSYEIIIINSKKYEDIIYNKYNIDNTYILKEAFGIVIVAKNSSKLKDILSFIQHIGCILSSRFAQDYLYTNNILKSKQLEDLDESKNGYHNIKNILAQAYNENIDNISLCISGMNAIYSTLEGIKNINQNKNIIIQLGWIYLDTMNILQKYDYNTKIFYDIKNIDSIIKYIEKYKEQISTIITEIPTNPLLLTVDIVKVKELCIKYNIILIIDTTLASAYNLNLNKYADIYIESLTKYACGNADVMMGAIIVNKNSTILKYKEKIFQKSDIPYIKDIQRLSLQIKDYKNRILKVNQNSIKLLNHLKNKKYIKHIYHTLTNDNKSIYSKLMRNKEAIGGIISLTFTKPFEKVYNTLNFAKGPSLGTTFTLLMPYVYLAHYDLIKSKKGTKLLKNNNIDKNILRVSVGVENIEDIIKEFDRLDKI